MAPLRHLSINGLGFNCTLNPQNLEFRVLQEGWNENDSSDLRGRSRSIRAQHAGFTR